MRLFLVQHGEAAAKELDPARPLTASGRDDVARVAARLAVVDVRPPLILHSGKLRARQTAELLAQALGTRRVEARSGLDPDDAVAELADRLPGFECDTLIVGHLPFLARLVSLLLCGVPDVRRVRFRTGSVVCLARGDDGAWGLEWMLRPELFSVPDA
ncbi:MAG: phosphohistidine phosphatase SixA [Gammaproteobacteria bacterium]|nr:phosphohistidine phosphatase SixA [Gammaproteobacteria bacterium]